MKQFTRLCFPTLLLLTVSALQAAIPKDSLSAGLETPRQNDCPITVDAGPDITICACQAATLNGSYSGENGPVITSWAASPPAGNGWLNNSTILTPTMTTNCLYVGTMTYTLTVQSVNGGCSASDALTVTVLSTPAPGVTNIIQATCTMGGAFTSVITGGVGPFTYLWSNGYTGPNPTNLPPGQYYLTVTGSNGCSRVGSWPIAGPTPANPVVNSPGVCGNNGTATLTVSGGNFINYAWSNGQSGNPITVSPGTYTVTVTATNNCTGTAVSVVSVLPPPTPSINSASICPGSTAALTVSGGNFNAISWSNGQNGTPTITVTGPGTYTVTVTGDNGCTATTSQTVTPLPSPVPVVSGPASFCIGNSATLTVSGGNFNPIAWSTGETTSSVTVNAPGTYTVTVTGANGCTASASRNVTLFPIPMPVVNGPLHFCPEGTATLTAGGGNFVSYAWSTGQSGNSITVSDPGAYTVTVTDANGCTGVTTRMIDNWPSPQPVLNGPAAVCPGKPATIAVSGGNFPAITWSTGQSGSPVNVQAPGTFSATVTDANGCTATASHTVVTFDPPTPAIDGPPVLCDGDFATLGASGGNFSQFAWSTGQTGSSIDVLDPGTYTVTVTDENGCTATASKALPANPPILPQITGPASLCATGANAVLSTGVFFQYNWSTGATTSTSAISGPGTYTVTVSDVRGCTGTDVHVVAPLPNPSPLVAGPTSICQGAVAMLDAGAGFASYLWSTGEATQSISTASPGTYTVTVSTASGCTGSASGTLAVHPQLVAEAGPDLAVCAGQAAMLSASGGTSFQWSDGQTTAAISVNPTVSTTYTVTVSSPGTCSATDAVTVQVKPLGAGAVALTLCPGETFSLGGIVFSQANPSGTATLTGVNGCDSLVSVGLSFRSPDFLEVNRSSCDPAQAGVVTQVFQNQYGCDSTVVTTTVFDPAAIDTTQVQANTCDPAQAGTSQVLLTGADGCDSLVVTTAVLRPSPAVFLQKNTCDPAQAGVTTQVLKTTFGCDSTVVTTTTLHPSPTVFLQKNTCDPAQAGVTTQVLKTAFGCDSTVVTTTTLHPSPTVFLQKMTCNPAQAGVVTQVLQTTFGCDSTVVTTTLFDPSTVDTTHLQAHTCDPAQAGTSQVLLAGSDGCDSLVVTTTALHPSPTVFLQKTTCDPAQAGVVTQVLQTAFGCDSTVVTTTIFDPSTADTTYRQAHTCDPAQAGTSQVLLTGADGCDSLVVTTTALHPSPAVFLQKTTCDPAQAGVVTQMLQTAFGCDSTVVTTTIFDPLAGDTTYLQAHTCDPAQAGTSQVLLTGADGCDSLVVTTTALHPAPTVFLQKTTCDPAQAGVTTQVLQTTFGCDSTIVTTTLFDPSTADTTYRQAHTCDPAQAGTSQVLLTGADGCDSLVVTTTALHPSPMIFLQKTTCDSTQLGSSTQVFKTAFGCDSLVTTTVVWAGADCLSLSARIEGQGVSCFGLSDGQLLITALSGAPPFQYAWTNTATGLSGMGMLQGLSQTQTVTGLPGGSYVVEVSAISPAGEDTTATYVVEVPFALVLQVQATSNFQGFAVRCADAADGSAKAVVSGGTPPHSIVWSNGAQAPVIGGLTAGWLAVSVTDAHGCLRADSLLLSAPPPLVVDVQATDEKCAGEGNGAVQAQWVSGGVPPLAFSFDGGGFAPKNHWSKLPPGDYTLRARDALGCETGDLAAPVLAGHSFDLDAGLDTSMLSGDTLLLSVWTSHPVDTVLWSPGQSVLPVSPQSALVFPMYSTDFQVVATDANGCRATDRLLVRVVRKRNLYAPNAIYPDGAANGTFTIFGDAGVKQVDLLRIYDRWGTLVFEKTAFPPNIPELGWNGTYRNSPAQAPPAVYAYYAVVRLSDETTVLLTGDITVIR